MCMLRFGWLHYSWFLLWNEKHVFFKVVLYVLRLYKRWFAFCFRLFLLKLKAIIIRTLTEYTRLFEEDNFHILPLIKMELILDDDDCIQFYPGLDELEAVILGGAETIWKTLQNIPTVQVDCLDV